MHDSCGTVDDELAFALLAKPGWDGVRWTLADQREGTRFRILHIETELERDRNPSFQLPRSRILYAWTVKGRRIIRRTTSTFAFHLRRHHAYCRDTHYSKTRHLTTPLSWNIFIILPGEDQL